MDKDIQQILMSLEEQVLLEVLHSCADDICGKKVKDFNIIKTSANWEIGDYNAACSKLKELLTQAVAKGLPKEQILQQVPELDASHQQCILDCLEVRRNEIVAVLQEKSVAISGPVLLDYDLKVKYVMGSSKLSSLRESLLSLDLYVAEEKPGGRTQNTISLELDKTELSRLISALEKAQDTIRNLQS